MSLPFDIDDLLYRAKGAFFGLAVGDALGATAEFMTPGEIRSKYGCIREITGGGWLRLKPGQVTDDTEMSLCIARAIVNSGGWSLTGIAENFASWLRSKPIDVGDTCRRGIRNFMLHGRIETPYNQWDAGNGACMRMLPVAIFTLGNDGLLGKYAVEQGHITHNHPLSDAACIYIGRLLHLALTGFSKNRLRRELEGLFSMHENFRFEPYHGLATAYVVDTLQTVFHFYFKSRDFEECLIGTVNQGGDADTTGAIAGMLAGAYYGLDSIPKRWLKRTDKNTLEEVADLAEKLVYLSPMVKGSLSA
jgi:ADP-ribosyl-[dinitrogen reductase] hydrolase